MAEPTVERSTKRLTRLPSITPFGPVATASEACSEGRLAITVSTWSAPSLGDVLVRGAAALRRRPPRGAAPPQLADALLARVESEEPVAGLDQPPFHRETHIS